MGVLVVVVSVRGVNSSPQLQTAGGSLDGPVAPYNASTAGCWLSLDAAAGNPPKVVKPDIRCIKWGYIVVCMRAVCSGHAVRMWTCLCSHRPQRQPALHVIPPGVCTQTWPSFPARQRPPLLRDSLLETCSLPVVTAAESADVVTRRCSRQRPRSISLEPFHDVTGERCRHRNIERSPYQESQFASESHRNQYSHHIAPAAAWKTTNAASRQDTRLALSATRGLRSLGSIERCALSRRTARPCRGPRVCSHRLESCQQFVRRCRMPAHCS